jgi:NAD dependent epimerase/dehydratase family enzyme
MPLTNESFTRALCKALHRPYNALVPGFATALGARILFGEMAGEMLLQGAFVYPGKLQAAGFKFRFRDAPSALADLL